MHNSESIVCKEISLEEPCLRCIFHPIHIHSSGKFKREALLPPPKRNDVSLFRQKYMSIEECILMGGKISMGKKQTFKAIASIMRKNIIENNDWAIKNGNNTRADVHYAPMTGNEYINKELDIRINDPNIELPAHAELRYESKNEGDVKTCLRQYASNLVKKMTIVFSQ